MLEAAWSEHSVCLAPTAGNGLMTALMIDTATPSSLTDLHTRLGEFANQIGDLKTPGEVLDALHTISMTSLPLRVLGAARFPIVSTDWGSIKLGKSLFLHSQVPDGWWDEYKAVAPVRFRPALFLAQSSLGSFT